MNNFYLIKSLENFARAVIQQSRSRLTKGDKNTSKELYESLDYEISVSDKSDRFIISFEMEDYGDFVDKGVSGKEIKYNTPFSFKNKYPPRAPLLKWAKMRGIRGRDKDGRVIKDDTFGFLLQRSIFNKGIKPSLFFTRAFETSFEHLPDQIIEDFSLDVDNFLKDIMKNEEIKIKT